MDDRTPSRPLAGLTVLDLSRVLAGPYATQMLGDLGAEVWKIERPGSGDETRGWGPPFVGEQSAYFLSVNRNKKSAVVDFGDQAQLAILKRAIRSADILVENFVPGDLARFGLDASALRTSAPELIVCSISGYGQDGPYVSLPGYDAVLQGFVGLMSITGEPERHPLKVGVAVIDVLAGVHAAAAILAALVGRLRGFGGTHLDVALSEVGVASLVNVAQSTLATGAPARRHGTAHPTIVPYQTFAAADADLVVAVGNDEQWRRLCTALGEPALEADARWATNPGRVLHREDLVADLARRFSRATRDEWLDRLRAARVPAGPVRDTREMMSDPVLRTREMVRSTTLTDGSSVDLLALPWRAGNERSALRLPPPALGEHTGEFMARFAEST